MFVFFTAIKLPSLFYPFHVWVLHLGPACYTANRDMFNMRKFLWFQLLKVFTRFSRFHPSFVCCFFRYETLEQQSKQRYPGLSLPSHPMQFLGGAHHIILKPDKSCSLSSLGRLYSFFHDQLVLHHHRPVQHCTNPSVHFLLHCPDQCFGCFHSPTVWLFHWESYSKNIIRGLKETLTALLSAVLCANTVHSTKPHTHTLILLTVLQTHWLWH